MSSLSKQQTSRCPAFETANLETEKKEFQSISTVDTPVQDVPTDAQVAQPVQDTKSEVHNTDSEENPMEVDQCTQCESVDLATGLALSEEAVLLGSPSEDVTSVSYSILESPPKKVSVKNMGIPYDNEGWRQRRKSFLKANSKDSELNLLTYAPG